MEAIIIDDVSIVDEQPAAIIRAETPPVVATVIDSQPSSPTHREVLRGSKACPIAIGISIDNARDDSLYVCRAVQIWDRPQSTEIVMDFLFETSLNDIPDSASTYDAISVASVCTTIVEYTASIATILKELNTHL
jgi:hypothetical protein